MGKKGGAFKVVLFLAPLDQSDLFQPQSLAKTQCSLSGLKKHLDVDHSESGSRWPSLIPLQSQKVFQYFNF